VPYGFSLEKIHHSQGNRLFVLFKGKTPRIELALRGMSQNVPRKKADVKCSVVWIWNNKVCKQIRGS
jgi:hypothetical protein